MQYKSTIAEKVDITGRKVTGFASIFGNVDTTNDIVWNGAFTKTIVENSKRFRHLWQHNTFDPPTATIREIREASRDELPDSVKSQFPEATGGLLVVREYLNTPRGNEILEGIKNDALNEMSFMYDIMKSDQQRLDDKYIYNLRELKLYETSDVNWGANEATVASKNFLNMAIQAGKQYIALKTEDTKEGRVLSTANIDKLKSAISTLEDILLSSEPITDGTVEVITAANPVAQSLKSKQDSLLTLIKLASYQLSEQ